MCWCSRGTKTDGVMMENIQSLTYKIGKVSIENKCVGVSDETNTKSDNVTMKNKCVDTV